MIEGPARLKGLHRATPAQIGTGHRSLKMLRPICAVCAPDTSLAAERWWESCPHEPYIGERGERVLDKTYETAPDGSRILTGQTETTVLRPWPNFVPVSLVRRISSGQGPDYKRQKHGFIMPSELRCAAFPEGIADCCEYYECYHQDGVKQYNTGRFCREDEAVAVYQDATGRLVEVANGEIALDQFEADRAKVRVVA